MNSPYIGKFRVSQEYKGSAHDGLDFVGIDSKEIHSTVNGTVVHAGWENSSDHSQGFGQYVKIKQTDTDDYYYYGHLSEISVTVNQTVKITDVIGIEGSTGKSTGSHCHYCVRVGGVKGQHKDISAISGIPNELGTYDDGYRETATDTTTTTTTASGTTTYTVAESDALWAIASKLLGDGSRYMEIKALNNLKSNIIHVGDVLEIPES
ncbi:MAG: peptidoglycan DD-metalloendopeptidase family protein [Ruminococcus sp.]|nr:peptidoglycan DD-metalloendopeptidase family protein [Ruminococcus sp.]